MRQHLFLPEQSFDILCYSQEHAWVILIRMMYLNIRVIVSVSNPVVQTRHIALTHFSEILHAIKRTQVFLYETIQLKQREKCSENDKIKITIRHANIQLIFSRLLCALWMMFTAALYDKIKWFHNYFTGWLWIRKHLLWETGKNPFITALQSSLSKKKTWVLGREILG